MPEQKPQSLNEIIVEIVRTKHPTSVEELVRLVQQKTSAPKETIIDHVSRLRDEAKIILEEPIPPPTSLSQYLLSVHWSRWFWIVVGLIALTILSVFLIPSEATSLAYIRWIFGFIFILFLPGYCFVEALFPKREELDDIERVALGIGLSLAISPLTALVLNFTPWGIRLIPVVVSLVCVTLVCALVAVARKFQLAVGKNK
ncbi:DUF1616 domain-containing protein [Candidatus Bathyarchaeota archaeon]|nr:DUF1616 domain-containing protein [Candidatus Bathyarchaeota archaeon]